eukprot:gnl/MRDRNA2_/MRDRNA2_156534_c0_seq1.p1 gnl/MRDRNA2_/MRDRNA2_156534_c0~~gnl/MRDRNA2_/MRDRNA2_156534_c0_seq1.p1  ORF type:complete len:483 (-),score=62.83 gnl/MRDRNA2_/MRDRNA2_156534_c0_seq1:214-1662(-)
MLEDNMQHMAQIRVRGRNTFLEIDWDEHDGVGSPRARSEPPGRQLASRASSPAGPRVGCDPVTAGESGASNGRFSLINNPMSSQYQAFRARFVRRTPSPVTPRVGCELVTSGKRCDSDSRFSFDNNPMNSQYQAFRSRFASRTPSPATPRVGCDLVTSDATCDSSGRFSYQALVNPFHQAFANRIPSPVSARVGCDLVKSDEICDSASSCCFDQSLLNSSHSAFTVQIPFLVTPKVAVWPPYRCQSSSPESRTGSDLVPSDGGYSCDRSSVSSLYSQHLGHVRSDCPQGGTLRGRQGGCLHDQSSTQTATPCSEVSSCAESARPFQTMRHQIPDTKCKREPEAKAAGDKHLPMPKTIADGHHRVSKAGSKQQMNVSKVVEANSEATANQHCPIVAALQSPGCPSDKPDKIHRGSSNNIRQSQGKGPLRQKKIEHDNKNHKKPSFSKSCQLQRDLDDLMKQHLKKRLCQEMEVKNLSLMAASN